MLERPIQSTSCLYTPKGRHSYRVHVHTNDTWGGQYFYCQQCLHAHCAISHLHYSTSCTPCLPRRPPFFSLAFSLDLVKVLTSRVYFIFVAVFDFKLSLMGADSCIFHLLAISPCYILFKTKL